MTAKEYLKQYQEAARRAERLRSEYENELILIDAVRSVSDNDGMPHGNGISKPTEDKAIRLADKALAYQTAALEAIRIRQQVFDLIETIPGEHGAVLYERYVNLKTWDEVAQSVGYSVRQTFRIHGEALDMVKDVIEWQTLSM